MKKQFKYGRYSDSTDEAKEGLKMVGIFMGVMITPYILISSTIGVYNYFAPSTSSQQPISVAQKCEILNREFQHALNMRDAVTPQEAMTQQGFEEWERWRDQAVKLEEEMPSSCKLGSTVK